MNKRFLQTIALTAVCMGSMFAQRPGGGGTPPTAAERVTFQVERLTSLLTLTSAQQAQATTIFTAAQTAESTLQTSLQTAHTALETAVQKNDFAGINTQASQIGSLTTQLTLDQAKAEAAFYQILTPAQQTVYSSRPMRGFGGPGGPGGFGGARPGRAGGPRQQ